jgi:hypothetical protein
MNPQQEGKNGTKMGLPFSGVNFIERRKKKPKVPKHARRIHQWIPTRKTFASNLQEFRSGADFGTSFKNFLQFLKETFPALDHWETFTLEEKSR